MLGALSFCLRDLVIYDSVNSTLPADKFRINGMILWYGKLLLQKFDASRSSGNDVLRCKSEAAERFQWFKPLRNYSNPREFGIPFQFQAGVIYFIVNHVSRPEGCVHKKTVGSPKTTVNSSDLGTSDMSWCFYAACCAVVAAMQGMLVMESVDPCRISFKKWRLLLILLAIQTACGFATVYLQPSWQIQAGLNWLT